MKIFYEIRYYDYSIQIYIMYTITLAVRLKIKMEIIEKYFY